MSDLILGQANAITFVLVDANGNEVLGLGNNFSISVSKGIDAFVAGQGTKSEIGSGWYSYLFTASECDTVGPLSVKITDASIVQQNLDYVVKGANVDAVQWDYTLRSTVDASPIPDVSVWVTTDAAGMYRVTEGRTNAFGVVVFYLQPGTYYLWRQKSGWVFNNPDPQVVS